MAIFSQIKFNDLLQYLQERHTTAQLRQLLADPSALPAAASQIIGGRETRIESWFSHLRPGEYEFTSSIDFSYNCIAFSANDASSWWWPTAAPYWPPGVLREVSEQAFNELYSSLGYRRCPDGSFQRGYEKVAQFAKDRIPTHAARQRPDGTWQSKLGRWEDIAHPLESLTGNGANEYGEIIAYFRRRNMAFGKPRLIMLAIERLRSLLRKLGLELLCSN